MPLNRWTILGITLAVILGVLDALTSAELYTGRRHIGYLFPRRWFE